MKKIILFFLICSISFSQVGGVQAAVSSEKITKVYSNFATNLSKTYSVEKQQSVLKKLGVSLDNYLERNLSAERVFILEQLQRHNNNYLFSLFLQKNNSNVAQKAKELQYRIALEKQTQPVVAPSFIKDLQGKNKILYTTNAEFDFVDGNSVKKIRFSRFFALDSSNIRQFFDLDGIIVHVAGTSDYRFITDYTFETRIPFSELENMFIDFANHNTNYFLVNNAYYSYVFQKFSYVDDVYGVYLSDLTRLGISLVSDFLYRDKEGRYNFVREYTKKKLISADIVDGVVDKDRFLSRIRDDKRELSSETDSLFRELKSLSMNLTKGKEKQDKILAVYDWVLKNTQYTLNINLEDEKIFSGIDTYKNGDGVCTGYSKLTTYMLSFAGIHDTQVLRGDVIDALDFPQIGHAWVRVGDLYYDPTFDDPIGAQSDKTPDQYLYYGLPKPIMYTNRFDKGTTPEGYKVLSLEKREDIVAKKLYTIADSYKSTDYLVLRESKFKKQNNIPYNTVITPEVLAKVIPLYTVSNNSFQFQRNGKTEKITGLQYYLIDDITTQSALRQISYNLDNVYVFAWETASGKIEYRLAYDVKID